MYPGLKINLMWPYFTKVGARMYALRREGGVGGGGGGHTAQMKKKFFFFGLYVIMGNTTVFSSVLKKYPRQRK